MAVTKYFRTTLVVEVLSENEAWNGDFAELAADCIEGACSGDIKYRTVEYCTESEMRNLLIGQSSDPGFFGLNEE